MKTNVLIYNVLHIYYSCNIGFKFSLNLFGYLITKVPFVFVTIFFCIYVCLCVGFCIYILMQTDTSVKLSLQWWKCGIGFSPPKHQKYRIIQVSWLYVFFQTTIVPFLIQSNACHSLFHILLLPQDYTYGQCHHLHGVQYSISI